MIERVPRGQSELSEQLRRAAISIPLNIAEGVGKNTVQERRRFHTIARGSAMECGVLVDLLGALKFIEPDAKNEAKTRLHRLVSMLSKMSAR